jgi:hypothetical protein
MTVSLLRRRVAAVVKSLHRVNTHILSYTDTYTPYTRSMKRLRKSCERRSLKMYSEALEAGVLVQIIHQIQQLVLLYLLLI